MKFRSFWGPIRTLGPGALTRGGGDLVYYLYFCYIYIYVSSRNMTRQRNEIQKGRRRTWINVLKPGKITFTSLPRLLSFLAAPSPAGSISFSYYSSSCTHLWKYLEMPMLRPEFSHSFFFSFYSFCLSKERTGCGVNVSLY